MIEKMSVEERQSRMHQLVDDGLKKTQKAATVKKKIKAEIDAFNAVKGLMDYGVSYVPQAAPAWAAVGLVLQVSCRRVYIPP